MRALTLKWILGAAAALAVQPVLAQTVTFLGSDDPGTSLSLSNPINEVRSLNGKLYANANDGTHGWEPWVSDGTPGGTYLLKDLNPGGADSKPSNFVSWNGLVFFGTQETGGGCTLWKTDGTPDGTVRVKDIPGRIRLVQFRASGDVLYFAATGSNPLISLYRTDGTEAGTYPLKTPEGFVIGGPTLVAVDGGFILEGQVLNSGTGGEFWLVENTSDTISLIKEINPSGSATIPSSLYGITMGGKGYFVATDGVHGGELWKSDGTADGTMMVKDMVPGAAGFVPSLGNFLTDNWIEESPLFLSSNVVPGVWKTDGTEAGTIKLSDADPLGDMGNFVKLNGLTLFGAEQSGTGMELWVSDGSPAGTKLLKDINPAPETSSSLGLFTVAGNYMYFRANDGTYGLELWRTDGTPAGTVLVKDIQAGSGTSNLGNLTAAGDYVVFTANDGIHGDEVWIAGPGIDGAKLVADLEPGANGSSPKHLRSVGSKVVFQATTTETGPELWSVSTRGNAAAAEDWQLFE